MDAPMGEEEEVVAHSIPSSSYAENFDEVVKAIRILTNAISDGIIPLLKGIFDILSSKQENYATRTPVKQSAAPPVADPSPVRDISGKQSGSSPMESPVIPDVSGKVSSVGEEDMESVEEEASEEGDSLVGEPDIEAAKAMASLKEPRVEDIIANIQASTPTLVFPPIAASVETLSKKFQKSVNEE